MCVILNDFLFRQNYILTMMLVTAMGVFITSYIAMGALGFIVEKMLKANGQRPEHAYDLAASLTDARQRESVPAQLIHLIGIVNSSVNMLIYCFKDDQFRKIAWQLTGMDRLCGGRAKAEHTQLESTVEDFQYRTGNS